MSRLRIYLVVVFGAVALFSLTACSEAPTKPLRVGINPWPGYAALFIAAEKGFFAEEGLDVELVELPSLSDVRRAFERGQVDGMTSSLVEVIEVVRQGDHWPIISLMADYSNGADMVLATKEINDITSLKGRRIGVEAGSLNQFILARALAKGGLSLDDVEVINLPQLAMPEAVALGEVDAVITYPPISTDVVDTGLVSEIFSTRDIPGEVADVVSFDREIVARRASDVDAFVRAWGRAVTFTNENPSEAYQIIGRFIGMTAVELAESYQGIEVIGLDRQAEFLRAQGPLSASLQTIDSILRPTESSDEQGLALERLFEESIGISWAVTE